MTYIPLTMNSPRWSCLFVTAIIMGIAFPLSAQDLELVSDTTFDSVTTPSAAVAISTIPVNAKVEQANIITATNGKVASKTDRRFAVPNLRICLGILGAASFAGGLMFDAMVKQKIQDNDKIREEFWDLNSGADHEAYTAMLTKNSNKANNFASARNAGYAIAAAAALGLYYTFKF
jgi:hypothetical protein